MTRLIVISSPVNVSNELNVVTRLFDAGLELFHLRKPGWTRDEQLHFLEKIPPVYLSRISLHQHHRVSKEFPAVSCHIKEHERNKFTSKQSGKKYSTSFHHYEILKTEGQNWSYCFFGPVFNSISKPGYLASIPPDLRIEKQVSVNVFALGGITPGNAPKVFDRGFYGIAALGYVWNTPENAIENFKKLAETCRQNVPTY